MNFEVEKARVLSKLIRGKGNWGSKYDRLEHFKRFQNLNLIIRELENKGWILVRKKPNYTGISLNPTYKSEIISFLEEKIPYLKGMLK